MSGIERAPDRESPHAGTRAALPKKELPADEPARTEAQGLDAYGCVDWFDYCPLPRTEPPVRRRSGSA